MPLVNLKSNLKYLKNNGFGHDRAQGGNSNQPYIQSPLPGDPKFIDYDFGSLDTDFILRGGSKSVTRSAKDVLRLGKYFLDIRNPSGLLFIAKQNLLSRTAVRTQASGKLVNEGVYTPISTLTQAGGNAFGLHVNKQGLNPFSGLGSLRTYNDWSAYQFKVKLVLVTKFRLTLSLLQIVEVSVFKSVSCGLTIIVIVSFCPLQIPRTEIGKTE